MMINQALEVKLTGGGTYVYPSGMIKNLSVVTKSGKSTLMIHTHSGDRDIYHYSKIDQVVPV